MLANDTACCCGCWLLAVAVVKACCLLLLLPGRWTLLRPAALTRTIMLLSAARPF
jgi:hypothetical protein